MRILIVEDDARLASVLRRGLSESGYVVDVEGDGVGGRRTALRGAHDAIVLDVMLPGCDGFSIARALRDASSTTPILMLTAKDTVDDTIAGLDAGADDYLRKPFSFVELEARLRAIMRRPAVVTSDILGAEGVTFDRRAGVARRGERALQLTQRELAFLEYFLRHAGQVVTRTMLSTALSNSGESNSNVIDVYVSRVRVALSACGEPPLIHTLRGTGYRFGTPRPR